MFQRESKKKMLNRHHSENLAWTVDNHVHDRDTMARIKAAELMAIAGMNPDISWEEALAKADQLANWFISGRLESHQDEAMMEAWGLIANAGGGNWETQSEEWQEAAKRWRDTRLLDVQSKGTNENQTLETSD